jgi:hypothetical protein
MGFGLGKYSVRGVTRRFTIDLGDAAGPGPAPVLIVRAGGETNPQWIPAILRHRPGRSQGKPGATPEGDGKAAAAAVDADQVAGSRRSWAAVFADAIIVSWENVAEDGQVLEYTPEAGLRFLLELLEELPDTWRLLFDYATSLGNFRDAALPAPIGAEALGKA